MELSKLCHKQAVKQELLNARIFTSQTINRHKEDLPDKLLVYKWKISRKNKEWIQQQDDNVFSSTPYIGIVKLRPIIAPIMKTTNTIDANDTCWKQI